MGNIAGPPSRPRIEGLDAWRVLLMLGGLPLHASYWQPPQPLFTAIGLVSHLFRMGCFFAISGLLCGLSMRKHSPRGWLARRVVQIGPPTLFGWGVLCPCIALIAHWYPGIPAQPMFDWHHVWFLVALLLYAPLASLVEAWDRSHGLIGRFAARYSDRRSLLLLLLSVGAVSFLLKVATEWLVTPWAAPAYAPMLSQTPVMAGCLPDYLLGLAMARSEPLASAMRRSWRSALLVMALTVALYAGWLAAAPALAPAARVNMGDLAVALAASLSPPAVFTLIFASAITIRRVPPVVGRLCDASLTIYLLHLPLLLAINAGLARLALAPYEQFVVAIALGAALSYAAHRCLVRPIPLLRAVVNGRIDALAPREPGEGGSSAGPRATIPATKRRPA